MTQTMRFGRVLVAAFCLGAILSAEGCGGGKGVVNGKVSYQGKTVKGGTVSFIPAAGSPVNSPIEDDGSYTVRNVPPGTAKISVETDSFRPPLANVPAGGGVSKQFMLENLKRMNPDMADPERAKRYVPIPVRYRDPDKSTLTYDVKGGKQQHDIDLK